MRQGSWLAALLAFAGTSAVFAMEVTPPVEFVPSPKGEGYVLTLHEGPLVIDSAVREIFLDGRPVAREIVALPEDIVGKKLSPEESSERGGTPLAEVSARATAFQNLKDGFYGQRLVVKARFADERGDPFSVHLWTHFAVSRGQARPLSPDEYSGAVDIVDKAVDPFGIPTEVFVGRVADTIEPPIDPDKAVQPVPVKSDQDQEELDELLRRPFERDER